ncbi:MAG TPA: hypothetical protein VE912_02270, partial [Bacteroidales bacterium]|nr:hypothetical protein [Bacteroidales bacterium]
ISNTPKSIKKRLIYKINKFNIMDKIKLVIWDLDDTFWQGTLSEGLITPINRNIKLVKELTNRGIINSIASKNDFKQVKKKLIEFGIWDYFIFPTITWSPKGLVIQDIIKKCQLRDINVLFLDDNHLNLEEAKFYNPNLHTRKPNFINKILNHKAFTGKKDINHTRLKQYKILEKKAEEKIKYNSNIDFLKSSDIKIEIIHNTSSHKNRINELIERTNQLNFTKIRSTPEQIDSLLKSNEYSSAVINVKDKFGDYGIVGFYSLNKKTKVLKHFVFSCRILNLGVAQYIYAKLDFPSINIVPEVAEILNKSKPNWISEFTINKTESKIKHIKNTASTYKIFFKGGCDLDQMLFYLKGSNLLLEEETNYVSRLNFPIHQEHTQILLDSINLELEKQKFIEENKFIPFTDNNFYKTKVFDFNYDCLVYSVLMDYTQQIYVHKDYNIKLPFGTYSNTWTNKNNHKNIIDNFNSRNITTISQETLNYFSNNFISIGHISADNFINNLREIRLIIPPDIPIIFINGAEIRFDNKDEPGAMKRHQLMNKALDNFINDTKGTYLLDVRKIINRKSQLTNNIRHYDRETYQKLSIELLKILNILLKGDIDINIDNTKRILYNFTLVSDILYKIQNKISGR